MGQIDRQVSVACPFVDAGRGMRGFFRDHGNPSGDVAQFTLGFDVRLPGTPLQAPIEREVVATIQDRNDPGGTAVRFHLQWAPAHPGPFPLFSGELIARATDDLDRFELRLVGKYQPPYARAGEVFDGLVGNRIALKTASAFLGRMRDYLQDGHEAERPPVPPGHGRAIVASPSADGTA